MRPFFNAPNAVGRTWAGLTLVLALLWGLSVAPPWLGDGARYVVYRVFDTVCHQITARSFQAGGVPLALCHRCFGVFSGLLLSALAFPMLATFDDRLMRRSRVLILAALAVVGADWALDIVGLWSNTPLSRTATGLVFGGVAGYFLARGFVDPARGAGPAAEDVSESGGNPKHAAPPLA